MTGASTPPDIDRQWSLVKSTIDRCAQSAAETDIAMRGAIERIAEYRGLKKQSLAGDEVDFGVVTCLIIQLELLLKEAD